METAEILCKYIARYTSLPVSEEGKNILQQTFKPRRLRKKQYLLQEGEISRNLAFIIKGALRQYSVDEKGVEHIVRLGIEQWWMSDMESYTNDAPSKFNIDAIEDSELLTITRDEVDVLSQQVPAFNEALFHVNRRSQVATQNRVHNSISLSAEKRFLQLQETYPELVQRFPQNMIASYLGISPETLSRIRKSLSLKQ